MNQQIMYCQHCGRKFYFDVIKRKKAGKATPRWCSRKCKYADMEAELLRFKWIPAVEEEIEPYGDAVWSERISKLEEEVEHLKQELSSMRERLWELEHNDCHYDY